ncbi:hypothetical protein F3J40_03700 [Pantoea sp. Acro-835]|uniref:Uncharacterized protein n=1 Tax=Candidatus Pantoea multigeneris TaxID=2608357 RepID=A0ABX0R5N5_9GAMM|nr:hypothetical protein [Pantoea multigeneris]
MVLLTIVGLIGIILIWNWKQLEMGFATSADYHEQDAKEYNYYTPDLLKRMPRISNNYKFEYHYVDAQEFYVYSLAFGDTTDTRKIREFLLAEGYSPQPSCPTEAECLASPRNKDEVSFYSSSHLNMVKINIVRSAKHGRI